LAAVTAACALAISNGAYADVTFMSAWSAP
jgi:hypothetical protein